jgi:uncharacterized protein
LTIYLLDVNVWVALAADTHIYHRAARLWFDAVSDDRLAFCRLTQLGFLRLLTNPNVMHSDVKTPEEAWQLYRTFRSDKRVGYLREPRGLVEIWDTFTPKQKTAPNLWTDAYLCAFANAAKSTLVTFDRRMSIPEGVRCIMLKE